MLSSSEPTFGGLSGLELLGRDRLIAISDRGWVMQIDKAPPHAIGALHALGGLPAAHAWRDVESIRRSPNGGWWVAFEGVNHIAWHADGWAGLLQPPQRVLLRHALRAFSGNRGLEAIAALPDGRGLAVLERTGDAPAFLFPPSGKEVRRLAYRTDMAAVDALALPDGSLLILTRTPVWPLPPMFTSRLEHAAAGWAAGAVFTSRPLFRLDAALPAENYEGMVAEPLPDGGWRIWLVADDNYNRFQSAVLAWLDLPAACLEPGVECRLERGPTTPLPSAPVPRSRPNPAPQ